MRIVTLVFCVISLSGIASAAPHEARIPLKDGKLKLCNLSAETLQALHLKNLNLPDASIDLRGMRGSTMVAAMNASLGDGCRLTVNDDALVIHVDSEKLPHNVDEGKKAARVFTAVAAPKATAAQARSFGLLLPQQVDPSRKMIVLVHGLDCDRENWDAMAALLSSQGYQVAYMTYPSDGPLSESAAMMTQHMRALHEKYPKMPTSILAYSMGGLVSRAYVEGDRYAGGISHLIMLGTPNQGSSWATYRIALEIREHYQLWRHEKNWSPTWMITDGLGEAGRDIKPNSEFLKSLNARPLRADVQYTIVAGSQHPVRRIGANAIDGVGKVIPTRVRSVWGFRQAETGLHKLAEHLRHESGGSDGPVKIASTQLAGVSDQVVIQADHEALSQSIDGKPPLAWDVIRDRLAN